MKTAHPRGVSLLAREHRPTRALASLYPTNLKPPEGPPGRLEDQGFCEDSTDSAIEAKPQEDSGWSPLTHQAPHNSRDGSEAACRGPTAPLPGALSGHPDCRRGPAPHHGSQGSLHSIKIDKNVRLIFPIAFWLNKNCNLGFLPVFPLWVSSLKRSSHCMHRSKAHGHSGPRGHVLSCKDHARGC